MKKHILTLTALTLTATLLAGCSEKTGPTPAQEGDSSTTQSTSTSLESTESIESTAESTPSESEPVERERFTYGEKEIPDLAFETGEYTEGTYLGVQKDGRIIINGHGNKRYDDRLLESMVFETHTFGDYTIRLVGDDVRTDKEHFPGIIYMGSLYIEVEKNGEMLPANLTNNLCKMGYPTMYAVGDHYDELMIYEDQIGSYIDVYDLKCPVIAMRYIYSNDYDESVRKIVTFSWIEDDEVVDHFFGTFAENTGVATGGEPELSTSGFYAVFAADEFKVENENTLVDETAGIKYIFDFDKTDDTGHYYSTERIQ